MRTFHFAATALLVLGLVGMGGMLQGQDTGAAEEAAAGSAQPMPDLFLAGWHNTKPIELEDYRGQVTALVFFTDEGG